MNRILCLLFSLICLFPLLWGQNCDGTWETGFQRPGTLTQPRAMVFDETNGYLYVGDPEQFGGDPSIEKVGRWDGKNWEGLGDFVCTSCGSGTIRALELGAQGDLYIGGFFEGAIGANGVFVPSKNVIKWNASTGNFESLGFGVEAHQVYALSFWNDSLVVGGRITAAKNLNGDLAVNNIALFDENTQTWSAMGNGIESFNLVPDDNGDVLALARQWDGTLYVGGSFSKINGNTLVYSMASWTPSAGWAPMADGVRRINDTQTPATFVPAIVRDIAVDASTDNLYVVGDLGPFNAPGSGLAKFSWLTGNWNYPVGLGNKPAFTGRWQTFSIYFRPYTNEIYVGGNFNSQDADPFAPVPGEYIAWFDVSDDSWHSLGAGITGAIPGEAVTAISEGPGDRVYIGGNFNQVDTLKARFMASWDIDADPDSAWDILGQGLTGSCDEVFAIGPGNNFIGGRFQTLGGTAFSGLSYWNSLRWDSIASQVKAASYSPEVRGLIAIPDLGGVTIGAFDSLNFNHITIPAAGMGYRDLNTGSPQALATSLGGPGNFQTVFDAEPWNGEIVAAGNFTHIDGVPIQGLGIRDTNGTWSQLAMIGSGNVRDILNDGDSLLYIAGNFRTVNGISVDGIAVFDGTSWSALGQGFGFYNNVWALAKDSLTGEIAVGGGFFDAYQSNGSPLASAGLAFWDGIKWKTRGEVSAQITNPAQYAQVVRAITYAPDGTLYIGGEFSGVDNVSAKRVARYHPSTGWQAVGGGISGSDCSGYPVVNVLGYHDQELMVGGQFSRAGDNQAHGIAIFDQSIQTARLLPDTFFVSCDTTTVVGLPGFTNWQWSTGDTGDSAFVGPAYFDSLRNENGRVWVYATAELGGCILTDSIEVAFVGAGVDAILDFGSFEEGDSTYIYYTPAFDTDYIHVERSVWFLAFNKSLSSPTDTVAVQMPCPGNYRYIIRAETPGCYTSSYSSTYSVSYQRPINMGLDISSLAMIECELADVTANPGYTNYQWSTGATIAYAILDDSIMSGLDSLLVTLTADTAWNTLDEDYSCTFTDSIYAVRHVNFPSPVSQQYSYLLQGPNEVAFFKEFQEPVDQAIWEFGDGTDAMFFPQDQTIGSLYQTHTYPGPGTYRVRALADSKSCQGDYTMIEFDVIVGTSSISEKVGQEVAIIPHPNTGAFTLQFPRTQQGTLTLSILDLRGSTIYTESFLSFQGKDLEVELNDLNAGLYLLRVEINDQSFLQKLRIK